MEKRATVEEAVIFLKSKGIDAFEQMNILVIPIEKDQLVVLDQIAKDMKRYLQECGYEKSWRIDPYYYENRQTLSGEMYADDKISE